MHEILHFPSKWADLQMRVDFPQHKSSRFVLYFPGVSGGAISQKTDGIAEAFARAWFHFVRFEYRSYLEKGQFDRSCLREDHADIQHALDFLDARFPDARYWAVWKSFGGLRLLSLDTRDRFECIGLLAPAVFVWNSDTVKMLTDTSYGSISSVENFRVTVSDLEKIHSPIVVIHGGADQIVPISNSELLITHFSNPNNRLVRIDGSGHSFDDDRGHGMMCDEVVGFFVEHFCSHSV